MSRAFIKDGDDAETFSELPEKLISDLPNLVTAKGLSLIEAEVSKAQAALAEAEKAQDREAIAYASRDLRYWSQRKQSAQVQPAPQDHKHVKHVMFGSTVTVKRSDGRAQTFRIVGEDEADPTHGTLSYASPLAHAMMGKVVGDVVQAAGNDVEIVKIG